MVRAIGFDYLGVVGTGASSGGGLSEPNAQILALVDRLRAHGYAVGLASNLTAEWAGPLRDQLAAHFDAITVSGETGVVKPDPRAFQELARLLGVRTDEMVFIDDHASNLVGLDKLGITPIVYENYDSLVASLNRLAVQTD